MILQALTKYYEQLVERGELEQPGWSPVKVTYILELEDDGSISNLINCRVEEIRGKKTVMVPAVLTMPAPVKRSSGIAANFLSDNSAYILGTDNKGKPKRSAECFEACKELHHKLLDGIDHPAAKALLNFFDHWTPSDLTDKPLFAKDREEIIGGVNLTFRYNDTFLHEVEPIRQAWTRHYNSGSDGPEGICLVTGESGPLAQLHPSIKGVMGAQSSGASLVSFNAPAFCSYGKEQGMNAPTGSYAAFAYGAALNDLLSRQNLRFGDTTVLMWAESAQPAYCGLMSASFFFGNSRYTEQDLMDTLESLSKGHSVDYEEERLDPDMTFYILGLAPNAARLSVRFFLRDSFGGFISNVMEHHRRMEMVRPKYEQFATVSLKAMLDETVNQNSRDKSPKPGMAGEVLRAILNNSRYPASLLQGMNLRIRADREMNRNRAAILKAYYLKNPHPDVPKEVLTVSLNPESTNIAYQLGRLFSVLEDIQQKAADSNLNTTIKDKYFSSASATPAVVFPTLVNLAQKHLKKLNEGTAIARSKEMQEIMSRLGENYPTHQNLAQQGSFQLGYYHQTQYRYTKKEDK